MLCIFSIKVKETRKIILLERILKETLQFLLKLQNIFQNNFRCINVDSCIENLPQRIEWIVTMTFLF